MSDIREITAASVRRQLQQQISASRLKESLSRLVNAPSPTGTAALAADALSEILIDSGFSVQRPIACYPESPAVVSRYTTSVSGRTLQFSGHLDTVHLPFSPARVVGDRLYGSGAVDMKGGIAAAVEAMRILRDTGLLTAGGILLTAYDLHECPWGDSRQLESLIAEGCVGDAVLLPEYLNDRLPLSGRGGLIWKIAYRRNALPSHELLRGDEPNLLYALAETVDQLRALDARVQRITHPIAGCESAFVGQVHGGSLYNQVPQEVWLEGTRRWLPGTTQSQVEQELRELAENIAQQYQATATVGIKLMRGPFELDPKEQIVDCFQKSHQSISGHRLPFGAKPFVDDGNTFSGLANVPTITHGPSGDGAHTENEWVSLPDLERVALLYAMTAVKYCSPAIDLT